MAHSIFLAKAFSIYFIVMSLAMLFNRRYFLEAAIETVTQKGLDLLSSLFTFILGILLVLYHNVWVANWTVIITLLAWITLLKGIVRLLIPTSIEKTISLYDNNIFFYIVTLFILLLGVYLGCVSFHL